MSLHVVSLIIQQEGGVIGEYGGHSIKGPYREAYSGLGVAVQISVDADSPQRRIETASCYKVPSLFNWGTKEVGHCRSGHKQPKGWPYRTSSSAAPDLRVLMRCYSPFGSH